MPDDSHRRILVELVDWLVTIENLAHDVYKSTAEALRDDREVSQFIATLAENEAHHAELIKGIRELVAEDEDTHPPEIRLDALIRETTETVLKRLQSEVAAGTITRKSALALIAEVECTEWNEIFLYVLGTFGKQGREMDAALATIQEHERRVEAFISTLPPRIRPDLDIAKLSKIWDVRLLIVDDNILVRDLLAGLLKSIGQVTTADNGEQALMATQRHFFDVVVSDLRMPVMSGLDFYRQSVAEHPDLRNRFVFVSLAPTASELSYIKDQGLPLLLKPFGPDELVDAVQKVTLMAHDTNGTPTL